MGKHGHGKRKSTREAKDSKPKPEKFDCGEWTSDDGLVDETSVEGAITGGVTLLSDDLDQVCSRHNSCMSSMNSLAQQLLLQLQLKKIHHHVLRDFGQQEGTHDDVVMPGMISKGFREDQLRVKIFSSSLKAIKHSLCIMCQSSGAGIFSSAIVSVKEYQQR
ncbi:hypothetical protein Tco_0411771 [Tanacetum coccineum]